MSADPQEVFTEAERTDLSDWIGDWLSEGRTAFELAEAFGQLVSEHPANNTSLREAAVEQADLFTQIKDVIKRLRQIAANAGMSPEQFADAINESEGS